MEQTATRAYDSGMASKECSFCGTVRVDMIAETLLLCAPLSPLKCSGMVHALLNY